MPMNCDEAIEFLPWLLNGSLEAGERDEVRRHLATCESCRAALNDTREAWTIFSQHLPSEALVALAYGETSADIDPALAERHLASCPECAAELELARTSRHLENEKITPFPGPRPRQETARESRSWRAAAMAAGLAGLVAASGWIYEFQQVTDLQHLAQTLAPARQSPAPAPTAGPDEASRQKMASLEGDLKKSQETQKDLQGQLERLNGQLADLASRPRGGVPEPQIIGATVLLPPPQEVVRGQEKIVQAPKSNKATHLTLQTNADDKTSRKVEILDAGGHKLWSEDGLPQINQEYQIDLPADFLKPGRYTIQLYTPSGSKAEAYTIQVQ